VEIYTRVWKDYLRRPHLQLGDLSRTVAFHLEQQGLNGMAFAEGPGTHEASFRNICERNKDTAMEAASFHNAFAGLGRAVLSGAPDQGTIAGAFDEMEDFWGWPLHVRALGVYCQHGLNALGLRGRARSCLRVSFKSGEEIVIGG
jgi:hypothetical protein